MYQAIVLAKYIVTKCTREGHPISNLQLQKILYYIQEYYVKHNNQAFVDDIEAWQFGPVVPAVYYRFCGFGAMPITSQYDETILSKDQFMVDPIVEEKRLLCPWDMVNDTHRPGGAWEQTYQKGKGNGKVIPLSLIKDVG